MPESSLYSQGLKEYCANYAKPSKHKTLNQCWLNVGSPYTMPDQHEPNIGSTSLVFWEHSLKAHTVLESVETYNIIQMHNYATVTGYVFTIAADILL